MAASEQVGFLPGDVMPSCLDQWQDMPVASFILLSLSVTDMDSLPFIRNQTQISWTLCYREIQGGLWLASCVDLA
jgi:hypothetical protein